MDSATTATLTATLVQPLQPATMILLQPVQREFCVGVDVCYTPSSSSKAMPVGCAMGRLIYVYWLLVGH